MRLVLTLFFAVTAIPALAQGETRKAELEGRITNKVSTNDYPDSSLRANEQGMTSVAYEVNEQGRVTPGSCKVTATSGHERLDRRSCAVIEARFTFKPALNKGVPVKETRTENIFWRVPGVPAKDGMRDVSVRRINYYGRCLLGMAAPQAVAAVDLPLGSPEQTAAITAIDGIKLKCWTKAEQVKASPTLLSGSIAEAMLEERFGDKPLPTLAAGAAPLAARNGTEQLALCVVRRDPAAVRDLLASVPSGPAEGAAVARLVPHLQPCVTAGVTLRFNRVSMRALFAIALYRDAAHAAGDR